MTTLAAEDKAESTYSDIVGEAEYFFLMRGGNQYGERRWNL